MAATVSRVSLFVPLLLILLLATLFESTHGIVGGDNTNSQTISASGSGGSIRSLRGTRRNNQIVVCSEIVSKSKCSLYSNKCRWCRSEALDDMCFSKSEAWRLPPQVFSCD